MEEPSNVKPAQYFLMILGVVVMSDGAGLRRASHFNISMLLVGAFLFGLGFIWKGRRDNAD